MRQRQITEAFAAEQSTQTFVRQRKPYVDFFRTQIKRQEKSQMVGMRNNKKLFNIVKQKDLLQTCIIPRWGPGVLGGNLWFLWKSARISAN